MLQRALALALTLMTAGVWLSPETAAARSRQANHRGRGPKANTSKSTTCRRSHVNSTVSFEAPSAHMTESVGV